MTGLGLAHLVFVSMWGGVLITEAIIETIGLGDALLATRLHFWIDLLAEVPLVTGVLITGAVLTARIWPPSPLHLVKLGSALTAVGMNSYCLVFVILRYRHRHDPKKVERYGRHVRWSGAGFPFGLAAAYVGLVYFA